MKKLVNSVSLLGNIAITNRLFISSKRVVRVLTLGSVIIFTACARNSGKAKVSDRTDVEIEIPCAGYEFETTSGVFRSSRSGVSTDKNLSRDKAMLAAKGALAASISSTIKSVTDRYAQDRTIGADAEFSEKFENLTREVVNQKLVGVKTICQKVFQKKDGRYETYVSIELNTNEVFNGVQNSVNKDDKLRQDYDKQKFEAIFKEEMDKLAEEN